MSLESKVDACVDYLRSRRSSRILQSSVDKDSGVRLPIHFIIKTLLHCSDIFLLQEDFVIIGCAWKGLL